MIETSRKISPFSLLFALVAFGFSLVVFPYYTEGDQSHYIKFYEAMESLDIVTGYVAYLNYLGAVEPLYYLIVYLGSGFISKTLLFSIFNAILAYYLSKTLIALNVNKVLIFSLLLNYYLVVLFFAAERLKVSMTFFLISFHQRTLFKSYFFILLSILSHLQAMLLVVATKFTFIFSEIKRFFPRSVLKRMFFYMLIAGAVFGAIIFMFDGLRRKFEIYSAVVRVDGVIKPMVFMALTLLYAQRNYFKIILIFIPLTVASVIVGPDRIVIFCYFVFFAFAVQVRRGLNVGMILTLCYFLYQGVDFVINIIKYNTGYIFKLKNLALIYSSDYIQMASEYIL